MDGIKWPVQHLICVVLFSDIFLENTEFAWLGGSASAICASGDGWLSSAGTNDVEDF